MKRLLPILIIMLGIVVIILGFLAYTKMISTSFSIILGILDIVLLFIYFGIFRKK